jgi:hypothetical protein
VGSNASAGRTARTADAVSRAEKPGRGMMATTEAEAVAADADPIRTRVRELLQKYPELTSRQLHDRAIRMDAQIALIPLRSFHAKYVLPIKREQARAEGRVAKRGQSKRAVRRAEKAQAEKEALTRMAELKEEATRRAAGAGAAPESDAMPARRRRKARAAETGAGDAEMRMRIRETLIGFARRLAAAETKTEIIDVIAGIDDVVGEIVTLTDASRQD